MIQHHLFQAYQKSERFFWSSISSATAHTDDADIYATGVDNGYLNPAIQKSPLTKDTFQKELINLQNFYSSHNLPWVWVIEQHLIPQGLLENEPLEFLDKSSAMYFDLSNLEKANLTDGFFIEENNNDLTDWGLSLRQAYQDPAETSDAYLDVVNQYIHGKKKQACNTANFYHFAGYLNGIPICCLTLSLQEDRVRIDDVGTIPEHQNKGFATQMIVHAMQKAFQLGARFCFLEASQAGCGVYERIGFKKIFSNLYFKVNTYP